ncbi:hypothetical protein [Burkholderia multivorans]|uniref:hypothetical protein n=1 Tax=Burkholderia multivorans TaxID=87883 RepID=UPI000D00CF1F|nr:hypothetical protein [Burkholderia multivorans]PRE11714.1 hypothetical protein C6P78_22535 [Burkholderia multivorans]
MGSGDATRISADGGSFFAMLAGGWTPASTAIGYATRVELRDTKIREMSLRIQLSGSGGQGNRKCVYGSQVSLAASTFVHLRARLQ